MITVRRAHERHHERRRRMESWMTFFPEDDAHPLARGFGTLEVLDEDRLGPGARRQRPPHHEVEIVTYVREGAIAHEDSGGVSGIIQAGEFQRMSAGRGTRHSETNTSSSDWAHVFHLWLRPSAADIDPGFQQRRFSAAERKGGLRPIVSPDGRRASLHIHQDAVIYSALLEPGVHIVHELAEGRSAWLHLVAGEVTLADHVLTTGDGAGLVAERAVSLTAREATEILLLDLGAEAPRRSSNGVMS